jgi:hypothetical protein
MQAHCPPRAPLLTTKVGEKRKHTRLCHPSSLLPLTPPRVFEFSLIFMPNINSHLLPSSLFYQVPAARYRYTLHTTRQHVLHTPRRKEKSTSFTKILAYYTYTTLLTKKKKKKKKRKKETTAQSPPGCIFRHPRGARMPSPRRVISYYSCFVCPLARKEKQSKEKGKRDQ